ncbi:MAG: hypothetical protein V4594_01530 [Bacteroidota bacterium]
MDSIPIQVTELLNYSYSIAKALLKAQNEFHPFGVSMDYNGKISQRLVQENNDFPPGDELINSIQTDFNAKLASRSISAYSIVYDAIVTNPTYPEGISVVVAKVKAIYDDSIELYYLPYKNINGNLQYLEPWGEVVVNEN